MASSRRSEAWLACALAGTLWLAGPAARGEPAPLEVLGSDGSRVELRLGADEALVVHFWASWCPECVRELPLLEREALRCAPSLRIVAVNVGESQGAAEDFRSRHALRLPLLRDPDGRLWRRFARGLPANLFWTRDGLEATTGPLDASQWRARLAALGCRSEPS